MGLIALRPIAVIVAGIGLSQLDREDIHRFGSLFAMCGAILILTIVHLIPLPPSIWQALPGRNVLIEIDQVAGNTNINRPLSVDPEGTLNALYSLSIPAAVLLLAVKLQLREQMLLVIAVTTLALVSALVVVLQAAGSNFTLYPFTSPTPGIFANRNHQSILLAAAFPMLAASSYFANRMGIDRKLAQACAITIGLGLVPVIVVLGSRTGLGVAAVGLALALLIRPREQRKDNKYVRIKSLGIRLASASASVAVMLWSTFFAARDVAFSRLDEAGSDLRYSLWTNVVKDMPNWMPWGSGIGSFADTYQIHEPPQSIRESFINHAHNDWLEIAYTSGIPGILICCSAMILFLIGILRFPQLSGRTSVLAGAGLSVLFLLAISSLADYPLRTPILSTLLVLACIWASFPKEDRK